MGSVIGARGHILGHSDVTKLKQEKRQSPEEMRAVFRQMAEYAKALGRLKEVAGIPEGALPLWYDRSSITASRLLNYYHRKIRPLRPLRPAGRQAGKVYVSPDLALAVYEAKDRGMKWEKIARAVLEETIPSDRKARERLRKRVEYLAGVGLRLSRKKK